MVDVDALGEIKSQSTIFLSCLDIFLTSWIEPVLHFCDILTFSPPPNHDFKAFLVSNDQKNLKFILNFN